MGLAERASWDTGRRTSGRARQVVHRYWDTGFGLLRVRPLWGTRHSRHGHPAQCSAAGAAPGLEHGVQLLPRFLLGQHRHVRHLGAARGQAEEGMAFEARQQCSGGSQHCAPVQAGRQPAGSQATTKQPTALASPIRRTCFCSSCPVVNRRRQMRMPWSPNFFLH